MYLGKAPDLLFYKLHALQPIMLVLLNGNIQPFELVSFPAFHSQHRGRRLCNALRLLNEFAAAQCNIQVPEQIR